MVKNVKYSSQSKKKNYTKEKHLCYYSLNGGRGRETINNTPSILIGRGKQKQNKEYYKLT